MTHRNTAASSAIHVIFRTEGKPLRFAGVQVGEHIIFDEDEGEWDTRVRLFRTEKGSLIWAWDRVEHGYLPDEDVDAEQIQRADALVISATDPVRTPAEVAAEGWERRPISNARLADASIRTWHQAARYDEGIAGVLYTDVE